jgi:hypothetical protein
MTNVSKTAEKNRIRKILIRAALTALDQQGWQVARVKGRIRRITKNGKSLLAAIRTSQDTWIAFPRTRDGKKWKTLSDVEVVVAASVDDPSNPKIALVHMFAAKELLERFDRAYAARQAAGHTIQKGRGVWVSLYHDEATEPVYRVGAGIGIVHPPIAHIPLDASELSGAGMKPPTPGPAPSDDMADDDEPLTIAQAKARLARTLGVDVSSIKITVEA